MKIKRIHGIQFVVGLALLVSLTLPIYLLSGFLMTFLHPIFALGTVLIVLVGAIIIITPRLSRKLNKR